MVEFPTDHLQLDLQARSNAEIVIETAIMLVITTSAFFGNLMVCWAIFRNKRLRTLPNIYVATLAVSDILMASFCMPLSVEVLITSNWTKSFDVCQFQGFFSFFLAFTSLQTMTAMAINRYYRVVKPAKYGTYFTLRRIIASVGIVMVLASVGAGLHLVCGWAIYTLHRGKVICFTTFKTPDHEKGYIAFLDACYITFPVLVISICYFKIFRTVSAHKKSLFKNHKNRSKGKDDDGNSNESQENAQGEPKISINVEEVKITRTLFCTVLGFITCWSPIAVIDMIDSYSSHALSIPRQVYLLWVYLGYGSSSINPFIYGILNRSFRNEFLRILRFRCGSQTRVHPATVTYTNSVMSGQNKAVQDANSLAVNRGNTMEMTLN
jgi:hypothetical protein